MGVGKTVLQGSTVSKNVLPPMPKKPALVLRGEFNGRPATFGVDEDLISKHMLLVEEQVVERVRSFIILSNN